MVPAELNHVLSSHPDIMGGSICMTGTRVPLKIVLDNLKDGISKSELLEAYPALSDEHVDAILNWEYGQAVHVFGLSITA